MRTTPKALFTQVDESKQQTAPWKPQVVATRCHGPGREAQVTRSNLAKPRESVGLIEKEKQQK